MRNIFFLLAVTVLSSAAFASGTFLVKIDSYRNNVLRGSSRISTTLDKNADVRQDAGEFYLSRSVLLQKSSSANFVKLSLNIEEHLADHSFSVEDISEINSLNGHKTISLKSGNDTFRYEVTVVSP